MANQQIGYSECKDPMQAQIMANAMEQAGGDVFSLTEAGGRWQIWFKFTDKKVPGRINDFFATAWSKFEKEERARKRAAKREDPQ